MPRRGDRTGPVGGPSKLEAPQPAATREMAHVVDRGGPLGAKSCDDHAAMAAVAWLPEKATSATAVPTKTAATPLVGTRAAKAAVPQRIRAGE
mmetsp:Transcript_108941/g.307005  ORF Transcript_108941/g.307005 Transcript_108941/m.307005 type:complete len:93 (+) Transcript_108941:1308-1586(+)